MILTDDQNCGGLTDMSRYSIFSEFAVQERQDQKFFTFQKKFILFLLLQYL